MWRLYPSQAEAEADVAIIDARMGFTGNITTTWAVPRETADGQWAIPSPDDDSGLSGSVGAPEWPAESGIGGPA
jgi:hypothetical protein